MKKIFFIINPLKKMIYQTINQNQTIRILSKFMKIPILNCYFSTKILNKSHKNLHMMISNDCYLMKKHPKIFRTQRFYKIIRRTHRFLKKTIRFVKRINNNAYRTMLMISTTRNLKIGFLVHLYFIVSRTVVTI